MPRRRRGALALLLGVVAMLLAACGARVDTVLSLEADGSGVRTIQATASADDLEEYFEGSTDAIVEVIESTIPEQLTYVGQETDAEGATTFTFTLEFTDAADYEAKVIAVLGAGGLVDLEADPVVEVHDDTFQTGIRIEENFDSIDLLQWLAQGLVDAGLVDSDDRSSLMEFGDTLVEFADAQHSTSSSISYDEVQDFRFRGLTVTTAGLGTTGLTRTVEYDLAREAYAHDTDGFDAFFAEATPPGGTLTPAAAADSVWTLEFTADSPEQLAEYTNQALASSSTDFAVSQAPSDTDAAVVTSVVDFVECATICLPDASIAVLTLVPSEWDSSAGYASEGPEGQTLWQLPNSHDAVTFEHRIPFQSVDVTVQAQESGELSLSVTSAMSSEYAAVVGDAVESLLRPADTVGSLEVDEADDTTRYTVTVTGEDAEEFNAKLVQLWPDSYAYVDATRSTLFSKNYALSLTLAIPGEQLAGGVTDGIDYVVELADGATPEPGSSVPSGASVDGSTITFSQPTNEDVELYVQATATKWLPIGAIVAVVLLVVGGLVVAVVRANRKSASSAPMAPPSV